MNLSAIDVLSAIGRATLLLSVAAVAAVLIVRWLRINSPTWRWRVWGAALLCGCCYQPFTLALPWREPAPKPLKPVDIAYTTSDPEDEVLPSSAKVDRHDETALNVAVNEAPVARETVVAPTTATAPPASDGVRINWLGITLVFWVTGILCVFVRGARRYARYVRAVRDCTPAPAEWSAAWRELLAAHGVNRSIPLLVGEKIGPALCLRPRGYALVLCRPIWEAATPESRELILRHELAHYLRGDLVRCLAARWLAAPHWFNPFAHLVVRSMDEAAEWACDDWAAGGREARLALSKTLVGLSETSVAAAALQANVQGRALVARVRRLLEPSMNKERGMKRALILGVIVAGLATCVLKIELVAREPGDDEQTVTSGPSATATAATVAESSQAPPVPKEDLRFDGKTFDEWQRLFQTELKPERRAEAAYALAEFGANGYGREAATTLVDALAHLSEPVDSNEAESIYRQRLKNGLRKIDPKVTVPLLLAVVRNVDDTQGAFYALGALQEFGGRAQDAAPGLLEVIRDKQFPSHLRWSTLHAARAVDKHAEGMLDACRALIEESDNRAETMISVMNFATANPPLGGEGSGRVIVDQSVLPLVVEGLASPYSNVRERASVLLAATGPEILGVLPQVLELADAGKEAVQQAAIDALVAHARRSPRDLQDCFGKLEGRSRLVLLDVLARSAIDAQVYSRGSVDEGQALDMLRRYDADQNGELREDEWREMWGNPRLIDTDRDGIITLSELTMRFHFPRPPRDEWRRFFEGLRQDADPAAREKAEDTLQKLAVPTRNRGQGIEDRKQEN